MYILFVTSLALPFYYTSLDIPKLIVNEALSGDAADYPRPLKILGLELFPLDQLPLLFALCAVFLALVFINGGFKYYINVFKGLLGERMLRRLRYELASRVLRFPLPHFRKVSQGEIIPMITAEVEPLGGFIGDAFALPALQGGLLLTAIFFIVMQDPFMGLAAVALYPMQGYFIPKLQRRVNLLGKARVKEVRKFSDRISETVSGAQEIHAHNTARYELADFAHRLGRIFDIRYQIYRKKFFIKFLNNFLAQLTPFFFFTIGGYLVIQGRLSLGSLVAVLAAYKDLAPPWKELLNYYQMQADARIKYEQVTSQFEPPGMWEAAVEEEEPDEQPLAGEYVAANLSLVDEEVKVVDAVSVTFGLDERVAVVGTGGSGKEELALLLGRLLQPTSGRLTLCGRDMRTLPEAVIGRRLSFVGPTVTLFSASLGDNLYYGLKHRPQGGGGSATGGGKASSRVVAEAALAGNTTDDVSADWIDYKAAGVSSPEQLKEAAARALAVAALTDDVYELGLRGTVAPARRPEVAERVLAARLALRARLGEVEAAHLVEPFDRTRYNTNATLGENLLFGHPVTGAFDMAHLAENTYVLSVLEKVGLVDDLLVMGHQAASTVIEIFADLPPDHELFQRFSFIGADDLPEYQALVGRTDRERLGDLKEEDRELLLSLPFKLVPARHRLGIIDERVQGRLLEARKVFARDLPAELRDAVEFLDRERYSAAATLQDNILFGKVAYGHAHAVERVGALISQVIDELGLRETVIGVGLDFEVGVGGSRLSTAQRQKLALARSVLKHPDVLIISEATATLDGATQAKVMDNLLSEFKGRGLIWVLHRPSLAKRFNRILVMRAGRIVEQGHYAELDKPGTYFRELIEAE
ncbi:MAG: ABC transporter transmembrane domain-containing protein [Alphaproteobacteria bacterium]